MTRPLPMLLMLSAAALPALAGVENAKRLLDQAAPRHCEILTMRFAAQAAPAGAERAAAVARLQHRAAEIEAELAAPIREYEAAMATLPPAERDEIQAHGLALLKACAARASAMYGVEFSLPSGTAPAITAVPYRAPAEKALSPRAQGGAVEAQSPRSP